MSDDLEFIVIDDIPEYIFCIGDDEENEQVIALSGKDGAFKYEKVDELPTTGEDGVLYLVPKSHTTQTASGNPINVNITDNAGKIESLKLDGDTYQQTYTGKNLFNKANVVNGIPSASDGSITSTSSVGRTSDYIPVMPNTAYSHTGHPLGWATIAWYKSDKSFIERTDNATTTTSPNEAAYARVSCAQGDLDTCQFEIGQPTAYEPYVGGQASPNPDYPQAIQTVTGEQTVSINDTDYPISLGSIELCKLGTYQDYIYKDGDSWKVRSVINKYSYNGSEDWDIANSGTANYYYRLRTNGQLQANTTASMNCFSWASDEISVNTTVEGFRTLNGTASNWQVRIRYGTEKQIDTFKTWLGSLSPVKMYVVNGTATDTVITDTTLISQLEAVRTAALSTGSNTISNTATGTNLAGDLELGYYGYDPLNKYDKYFWLDVDGAYESL